MIVALDQLTKWWAVDALGDGRIIDVVWTLRLQLVRNPGAAFSSGVGLGPLIGLLAPVIVGTLLYMSRGYRSIGAFVAVGAVIGGAIGNLLDRIFRAEDGPLDGKVIDFINFQWWPVFNIADMGVVVGAAAMIWFVSREGDHAGER